MVFAEFQAIVLAGGRGTRIPELTGDNGDRPKCLLPIGPFPMVFYPLHMLQEHGFSDVIVIVVESQKTEIQQTLEKTPLKLKIDFVTIPNDSDFGTAESLKFIKDKIKTDLLIVSCDTITNASLDPLFTIFRQHNASIVTLLMKGGAEADAVVPGLITKHKPDRDLIGIHPDTNRLLYLASISDFEDNLCLPGHLLRKNGEIAIHSRLIDSHIYLIKKWIVNFLAQSEGFSTIKGELLPYIVKKQMARPVLSSDIEKPTSVTNDNVKIDDVFNFIPQSELETKITDISIFNDSKNNNPYNSDIIRCFAVKADKNSFGLRVNTTLGYCAINQMIFTIWDRLFENVKMKPSLISSGSTINSTQITMCAVSDNTLIAEKTSLKNCVFGTNCEIKCKVRISGSILMNGVIIEEGVSIENSIICDKAVIKKGSNLKNCLIGPNFIVNENSKREAAHLANTDEYMEFD